jgi:GNAT superfamily N-acetyltransferase
VDPDVAVRSLTAPETQDCEAILRSLPDWFGIEEAIVDYVEEIEELETFGAWEGEILAGFVTLKRHFAHAAEVHVMAVRAALHRRGIGRGLLEHAESELRSRGVRWLQVKTLGPSCEYQPYADTRAFYLALGFEPIEESESRWPGNPSLQMIKQLRSAAGSDPA